MDNDEFKQWLKIEKGLSARVIKDVLSRFKRGCSFINVDNKIPIDETLMLLERESEFICLTKSVKSQIRRALRLHHEFTN